MMKKILCCVLLGLSAHVSAFAAVNMDTTLTDTYVQDATPTAKSTFTKETPMIFIVWKSDALKSGQTLKANWIALDTNNVAPANYKIDSSEMKIEDSLKSKLPGSYWEGKFTMNKPTNGWPAGKYHVEIFVNDELVKTVPFTVAGEQKAEKKSKSSWGAIAIDVAANKDAQYYGIGGGVTKEEAEKNAQSFCIESGAKQCHIEVSYQQCGAFALADHEHKAAAIGASKQLAEASAKEKCSAAECAVVISDCN